MSDDFQQHIPHVRLFLVAVADNMYFSDEETNHVKQCSDCYRQWKIYIDTIRRRLEQ
jgi:hypothetical protein